MCAHSQRPLHTARALPRTPSCASSVDALVDPRPWVWAQFCELVGSPRHAQKRSRELEELTLESQPALAPSARVPKVSKPHTPVCVCVCV